MFVLRSIVFKSSFESFTSLNNARLARSLLLDLTLIPALRCFFFVASTVFENQQILKLLTEGLLDIFLMAVKGLVYSAVIVNIHNLILIFGLFLCSYLLSLTLIPFNSSSEGSYFSGIEVNLLEY